MPSWLVLYFADFPGGCSGFHEKALITAVSRRTSRVPIALCIPPGKDYIIVVFDQCSCGETEKLVDCSR